MPRSVREHPRLGLDLLGREDAAHGCQQGVAVEELEVAGQLLDTVDLAAPLDLDGHTGAGRVAAHQVDGPDRRGELPAYEGQPLRERGGMLGQQLLEVLLDPVLLQPGVDAELVRGVAEDLLDQDLEGVVGLAGDRPEGDTLIARALAKGAGRRHPVQRLVGAAVGVHEHRAVGLDHQHAGRHREVGGQSSGVVHLAARDHDPHGRGIYPVRQTRPHVGPGGRRRGGRRGPQLRPPAPRGRASRRRAGARPSAGDDLERRGRRLVSLPRPAAGQGHRLGTGDVRRAGAPGCRREDRRGDAPRDGAAGRGDSGPLVDRRRAGAGEACHRERRTPTGGRSWRRWSRCRCIWRGSTRGSRRPAAP